MRNSYRSQDSGRRSGSRTGAAKREKVRLKEPARLHYQEEAARPLRQMTREERRQFIMKRRARQLYRRMTIAVAVPLTVLIGLSVWAIAREHRMESVDPLYAVGAQDAELAIFEEVPVQSTSIYEEAVSETLEEIAEEPVNDNPSEDAGSFTRGYEMTEVSGTQTIPADYEDVNSGNAVLIDLDDGTVVAQKNADVVMPPASMTKILTLLVASEKLKNYDDIFTITLDITDYTYRNGCSAVGFADGEVVTVRDLLYGTILPSGADAALGLATYVAGSEEAFVAMMNAKVKELGLSETAHFGNVVGIYDEETYCTVRDMAMILKAAMENKLCREVMNARTYTTSRTEQHPEGIQISNWFLRRIEDKEMPGEVMCAKTGFVNQSGSCAASYFISDSGNHFICVTENAHSAWRCIYDHVAIYNRYTY